MKIYQTRILEADAKKPTKSDFHRITYKRSFHPSKSEYYFLKNQEAGELGEKIVFNYLEKYGKDDWTVVKNMWMDKEGPFEADLILLTNHGPYLFEIKNYATEYKYENGVSTFGDRRHSGNPINQTIRNKISLENILNGVKVQGVLCLVGVDNYVEINSEVPEIKTVERNELKKEILKIVDRDNKYNGKPINNNYLLKQMERYEIHCLQNPTPLLDHQVKQLQSGICCMNCENFDLEIRDDWISCGCGFKEKREIAILRTICEYSVLTFNRNVTTGPLASFFRNQISKDSIREVLKKYFKSAGAGRNTIYITSKLPLSKLYSDFNIKKSIEWTLSHEDYSEQKEILYYYEMMGL